MATAIYSAITKIPVDAKVAMTGELSIFGKVKPIGGVVAKIEAARLAGAKKVIIPKDNWQKVFEDITELDIFKVDSIKEVLQLALVQEVDGAYISSAELFSATPASININL